MKEKSDSLWGLERRWWLKSVPRFVTFRSGATGDEPVGCARYSVAKVSPILARKERWHRDSFALSWVGDFLFGGVYEIALRGYFSGGYHSF